MARQTRNSERQKLERVVGEYDELSSSISALLHRMKALRKQYYRLIETVSNMAEAPPSVRRWARAGKRAADSRVRPKVQRAAR